MEVRVEITLLHYPEMQVREHTDNGNLMEGKITSLLLNSDSLEEVATLELQLLMICPSLNK